LYTLAQSLRFDTGDGKTKDSELNVSKRFPHLICSQYLVPKGFT